jgi:hypothetical protein
VDFSAAYQRGVGILWEEDDERTGRHRCPVVGLVLEKLDVLFGVIARIRQRAVSRGFETHLVRSGDDVLDIDVLAMCFQFRFGAAPAWAFTDYAEQAVAVDFMPAGRQLGQSILSEERESFFKCRVYVVIAFGMLKPIDDNMISFHLYFGLLLPRTGCDTENQNAGNKPNFETAKNNPSIHNTNSPKANVSSCPRRAIIQRI